MSDMLWHWQILDINLISLQIDTDVPEIKQLKLEVVKIFNTIDPNLHKYA